MGIILCATDLSLDADVALGAAADAASRDGSRLVVMLVLPSPPAFVPTAFGPPAPVYTQLPEFQSRALEAVGERVRALTTLPPERVQVHVEHGRPDARIVQHAEEIDADLVVVGARGATGLDRLLLGSVAERVVRHAHCPVLVARPGSGSGCVLAATDFSDPALPAVAAAAAAARHLQAPLVVVHATDATTPITMVPQVMPGVAIHTPAELEEKARQAAATELEQALAKVGAAGERVVLQGPAGPAIVRSADERGASLVVVGTTGKTGLRRMLLGSVAETVVRTAHCSVLVVRLHRVGERRH